MLSSIDRSLLQRVCRVLQLHNAALLEHVGTLNAVAEFSAWMLWYYITDRTTFFPFAAKSYSRDIFGTSFAVLVVAAFAGSIRSDQKVMTLSRHQTEEWKGWMQVCRICHGCLRSCSPAEHGTTRAQISYHCWGACKLNCLNTLSMKFACWTLWSGFMSNYNDLPQHMS